MSALRWDTSNSGYNGRRMTADQFFGLGETEQRLESVDGVIVMSPTPIPRHLRLVCVPQDQLARLPRCR